MKLPLPNINSVLAVKSHMYICESKLSSDYCFIKCQSFKNKYYKLNNYIVEKADILRNPFNHTSLIDSDKRFNLRRVTISEALLTKNRRDVSQELFTEIKEKMIDEECVCNEIDRNDCSSLNKQIGLL